MKSTCSNETAQNIDKTILILISASGERKSHLNEVLVKSPRLGNRQILITSQIDTNKFNVVRWTPSDKID